MVKKKDARKYLVILLLFVLLLMLCRYATIGRAGRAVLKGIVKSDICFEIDWIRENEEEKILDIAIYVKYGFAVTKNYARFYRTVIEELLDNPKSKYEDYKINIRMQWNSYYFYVKNKSGHMYIDSTDLGVSLWGIAKYFPEAYSVSIGQGTGYRSVDEIRGFDDLKEFDDKDGITKKQEEVILSIFPDCKILCPIKEDKKD